MPSQRASKLCAPLTRRCPHSPTHQTAAPAGLRPRLDGAASPSHHELAGSRLQQHEHGSLSNEHAGGGLVNRVRLNSRRAWQARQVSPPGSPAIDALARRRLRTALPASARSRRQSGQKKAPRGTVRSPAQYVCIARSQPAAISRSPVRVMQEAIVSGLSVGRPCNGTNSTLERRHENVQHHASFCEPLLMNRIRSVLALHDCGAFAEVETADAALARYRSAGGLNPCRR